MGKYNISGKIAFFLSRDEDFLAKRQRRFQKMFKTDVWWSFCGFSLQNKSLTTLHNAIFLCLKFDFP